MRQQPRSAPTPSATPTPSTAPRSAGIEPVGEPPVVIDALAARGEMVGALTLREFTLADLLVLHKINHPLVTRSENTTEVGMDDWQAAEVVHLLTRPAEEVLRLYAAGPAGYEAEVLRCCAHIPLAELPKLGDAVGRLFARALSTVVAGEKKTS